MQNELKRWKDEGKDVVIYQKTVMLRSEMEAKKNVRHHGQASVEHATGPAAPIH